MEAFWITFLIVFALGAALMGWYETAKKRRLRQRVLNRLDKAVSIRRVHPDFDGPVRFKEAEERIKQFN